MFRSNLEKSYQYWLIYEFYSLLYNYKNLQKDIISAYSTDIEIIELYKKITNRSVHPITLDYLEKNRIYEHNVSLIKNAIEMWRKAIETSDSIAPILFHYSIHCFMSFFNYTFFSWRLPHAKGHGITISLTDEIEEIKIIFQRNGIFQRLIDSWSLLGVPMLFSSVIPNINDINVPFLIDNETPFKRNDMYPLFKKNKLSFLQFLQLDIKKFSNNLRSESREGAINALHSSYSIVDANYGVLSYLILFIASCIARYRPILWQSLLQGNDKFSALFIELYNDSLKNYVIGGGKSRTS